MPDDQYWPVDWVGMQAPQMAPVDPSQVAPPEGTTPAERAPMGISQAGLDFLKSKEGWSPRAYRDGRQYSIGWGSKASGPGEVIDENEGEKRLRSETGPLSDWLNKNVGPLNQAQHDALVSFGYNLGQGKGGLADLKPNIDKGDWQAVADQMQGYYHAPSLPKAQQAEAERGLKARRFAEGTMLLGGQVPTGAPATAGGGGSRMAQGPTDDTQGDSLGGNLRGGGMPPGLQAALMAGAISLLGNRGWGSPLGNMAGAMGEAASTSQQYQQSQEQEQKKLQQQADIAKEHNQTQLDVANIHAQSMRDVAESRLKMGQLKNVTSGEAGLYNGTYNHTLQVLEQQSLLHPGSVPDDVNERIAIAHSEAIKAVNNHRALGGALSAPGGAPATPTATGGTAGEWNEALINKGAFRNDPEYRNKLREKNPNEVAALEKKMGIGPKSDKPPSPTMLQQFLEYLGPKAEKNPNYVPPTGAPGS